MSLLAECYRINEDDGYRVLIRCPWETTNLPAWSLSPDEALELHAHLGKALDLLVSVAGGEVRCPVCSSVFINEAGICVVCGHKMETIPVLDDLDILEIERELIAAGRWHGQPCQDGRGER